MTTARSRPVTFIDTILQFLLNVPHSLTDLLGLMANQVVYNVRCLTSVGKTQVRAHQKNAELLADGHFPVSPTWSDHEAPEEEMSDLSSDEEELKMQSSEKDKGPKSISTAQDQLFDGLQFYLAVSRVREHAVRSALALGMANTLATLEERKQNESIAVIEQRYPDFTCFPTRTRNTGIQVLSGVEQPPLNLLAALKLSSVTGVAQTQSHKKIVVRAHLAGNEEACTRRPSLSVHGPNISRVA